MGRNIAAARATVNMGSDPFTAPFTAPKYLYSVIVLLVPLLSSCKGTNPTPATSVTDDRTTFDHFIEHPTATTWNSLCCLAQKDPNPKTDQIVLAVARFTEAAIRRDLPNSMAQNEDPDEHQHALALEAEKEFASLRPLADEDLWRLGVALLSQDFDDVYHHASAEIVVRLFPSRYFELKHQLSDDKSLILSEEYKRWIRPDPIE